MTTIGYGPLARIDGPPPLSPPYGLLQAAAAPAAGVRIVVDTSNGPVDLRELGIDGLGLPTPLGQERWLNGVEVYPFPIDTGDTFDTCALGSDAEPKSEGETADKPQFGALTVYLPETCTSYRIWNQEEFKARAVTALAAIESSIVAHEFQSGTRLLNNPHLADANGDFPNGDSATSVVQGIALLEGVIAASGKLGLIHCSPTIATIARDRFAIDDRGGVLRTINGNVVIPDAGYAAGATPHGHASPSSTQEWIYATGPVDVRRSEIFTTPDTVAQALDRETNSITYRAERYYLVDWDTAVQAAVLVDRCYTTCTS